MGELWIHHKRDGGAGGGGGQAQFLIGYNILMLLAKCKSVLVELSVLLTLAHLSCQEEGLSGWGIIDPHRDKPVMAPQEF